MVRKMTCQEARAAMQRFVLHTLPDRREAALREHLEGCDACQEALAAERARLAVLDGLHEESVPHGLAERTLHRIHEADAGPVPERIPVNWKSIGLSAAVVVVLAAGLIPVITKSREAARRAATQGNMKQLGLVFKMYANAAPEEAWPKLASVGGWSPELAVLHGEFITDPGVLISEQHPERQSLLRALRAAWAQPAPDIAAAERLMGESFGYLGYNVTNETEFEALLQARERGAPPAGDGIAPLREGIERFMITDINNPAASGAAQSEIPVLIEIATWKHKKSVADFTGANVLYMDGHVSFVRLGTFPVVPAVLDALSGIEAGG